MVRLGMVYYCFAPINDLSEKKLPQNQNQVSPAKVCFDSQISCDSFVYPKKIERCHVSRRRMGTSRGSFGRCDTLLSHHCGTKHTKTTNLILRFLSSGMVDRLENVEERAVSLRTFDSQKMGTNEALPPGTPLLPWQVVLPNTHTPSWRRWGQCTDIAEILTSCTVHASVNQL